MRARDGGVENESGGWREWRRLVETTVKRD